MFYVYLPRWKLSLLIVMSVIKILIWNKWSGTLERGVILTEFNKFKEEHLCRDRRSEEFPQGLSSDMI